MEHLIDTLVIVEEGVKIDVGGEYMDECDPKDI